MEETRLTLPTLRRVLDAIHAGGNIYYSKDRMEAYGIIAKVASELRKEALCSGHKLAKA